MPLLPPLLPPLRSLRMRVSAVLLCGTLLTLLAFGVVRQMQTEKLDKSLAQQASLQLANLRLQLNAMLDQLRNARDIISEAEPLQENIFTLVAQHLLSEHYYVQHVAFRRIIPDAERHEYEQRMQRDIPGFRITELVDGLHLPAATRPSYHVIEHIAPAETGIFVRGLDAVSLDVEDDAIARAMSTGLPAATALYPQDEVNLPVHENSITLILPVYRDEFANNDPLHQFPPQIGEIALTLNVTGLFRELIGISPLFALDDIGIEIFAGTGETSSPALLSYGSVAAPASDTQPLLSRLLDDRPQ